MKSAMILFCKETILLLLLLSSCIAVAGDTTGHDIKITIKGLKTGSHCILANYYEDKQYIKDSALVTAKGEILFKGKEKYLQGLYSIVSDHKKCFDVIMDESQHYSMETDTLDYVQHMKVKGSEENNFFFNYQKFIFAQQKVVAPLRTQLQKTKDKDSIKAISDKLQKVDTEVRNYGKTFFKNNPEAFVVKFLTAMDEPVIPESPMLPNGKKDTLFPYHYYKAHFFDNIDFNDARLLQTPVFYQKVTQYMDKMTAQTVDSINLAADYLVEKSRNNTDMFKYIVYWLTYRYESSKIMGMDAIFVHMVEKYYVTHQAYWADSTQLEKIIARAYTLKPILIGKKAAQITMIDSTGKTISLYDVKAKYTIVVFWDEDCGHCQKEIPKLQELYVNKLKGMGVEVYAIATEDKVKAWKKFIEDHHLNWINVHQPDDYKRAVTKKIYDIISTPFIYVLDENKIIKAKHIDAEQVEGFIDFLEKEKNEKK
jgi:peroxiredoxin